MALAEKKAYKTVTIELDAATIAGTIKEITGASVAQILKESVLVFEALSRGEEPKSDLLDFLQMKLKTGNSPKKKAPHQTEDLLKNKNFSELLEWTKTAAKKADQNAKMIHKLSINAGIIRTESRTCPIDTLLPLLRSFSYDDIYEELGWASFETVPDKNGNRDEIWEFYDNSELEITVDKYDQMSWYRLTIKEPEYKVIQQQLSPMPKKKLYPLLNDLADSFPEIIDLLGEPVSNKDETGLEVHRWYFQDDESLTITCKDSGEFLNFDLVQQEPKEVKKRIQKRDTNKAIPDGLPMTDVAEEVATGRKKAPKKKAPRRKKAG